MSETQTGKIHALFEEAARQKESETPETCSVECASRVFSDVAEAETVFARLRRKLFRVEKWNGESEISSFYLFDENGIEQREKPAALGDFIKIILPGSGKSDWVKIVEISESGDETILTVQPSNDPTDAENNRSTSHFFMKDSTNNFCLQRKEAKINFCVIGLNEKTNTADTNGLFETVRNLATANLGSYLGVQKTQWQTFCDNFLEIKDGQ